jgi:hypothetical protein
MPKDLSKGEFLEALFEAWQEVWSMNPPPTVDEFGPLKIYLTAPGVPKDDKATGVLDKLFTANARREIKERDGRVVSLPREMLSWLRADKKKAWSDFADILVKSQA